MRPSYMRENISSVMWKQETSLAVTQVDGAGESKGGDSHFQDDSLENLSPSKEAPEELKVGVSAGQP